MKWSSETLESGGVGKEGVAQGGANQVGGVGRDVTTLVVTVQGKVQTEEILEILVLLTTTSQHGGEVVRPILGQVDLSGEGTTAVVGVLVDLGRDGGQLGEKGDGVIKGRLPVVGLVDAGLVGLGEGRGVVKGRDGNGELSHWVEVLGKGVEEGVDEVGELSLLGELLGELAGLANGGDLAGEEKPEHGLGKHLSAGGSLGELSLALLDGAAMEADTLVGVEDGPLPDHGLETTHATQSVLDLDLANDLVAVGLDLLEELTLGWDDSLHGVLQAGLRRAGVGAGGIDDDWAEGGGLEMNVRN